MKVSKVFKIKERAKIEAIFQAFDLTNRVNVGNNYQGNPQSPGFGQATGTIAPNGVIVPRAFTGEFGVKFSF